MQCFNECFSSCVASVKKNETITPFCSPNDTAEKEHFHLTPPTHISSPHPFPNQFGIFPLSSFRFKMSLCDVRTRLWLELSLCVLQYPGFCYFHQKYLGVTGRNQADMSWNPSSRAYYSLDWPPNLSDPVFSFEKLS